MDGIKRSFYWLVAATISLYLALGALFVVGWVSNNHRADEIQRSRVYSCQQTYESIKDVFTPFLTPPRKRTAKEAADIALFNKIINSKKANCVNQVSKP